VVEWLADCNLTHDIDPILTYDFIAMEEKQDQVTPQIRGYNGCMAQQELLLSCVGTWNANTNVSMEILLVNTSDIGIGPLRVCHAARIEDLCHAFLLAVRCHRSTNI
jgi:hypothetical protein